MPEESNTTEGQQSLNENANVGSEQNAGEGETSQEIENQEPRKVPYDRFKEVIDERNQLRGTTTKMQEELSQIRQYLQQGQTEQEAQSKYDKLAREAKNWGEFVEAIKEDTINEFQEIQTAKEKEAEEQLNSEIESLYSSGLVNSESEENKVINFAIKKQEELGKKVPLDLAYYWMQSESGGKESPEKKVSEKIQSSNKSDGAKKEPGSYEKDIRHKDLDEIIFEAKQNAPK